ncbi:MAG: helix-turn-helix domain-containing protein [Candidatus Adiutrix sp.]
MAVLPQFSSFLINASNRLAALALMNIPSAVHNLALTNVFVSATGPWGKSLLLESLSEALSSAAIDFKKISAGSFLEMVHEAKTDEAGLKLSPWRQAKIIIIDDVHHLAPSRLAQNFLAQIFDDGLKDGRLFVISGIVPPGEMTGLIEPLRSRLGGGLILNIEPPEYELLEHLGLNWAKKLNLELSPVAWGRLIRAANSDPRQLWGLLESVAFVVAQSELSIDEATSKLCLGKGNPKHTNISIENIIMGVASAFALKEVDLTGHSKIRQAAWPRRVAMFLAREMTNMTTSEIGEAMGGRDHSTVIHALKKIQVELETPARLKLVENIKRTIIVAS